MHLEIWILKTGFQHIAKMWLNEKSIYSKTLTKFVETILQKRL
jgi:hypothetical protein